MDDQRIVSALRQSGAIFAFLYGSRANGTDGSDSDVDVAAWWGTPARPAPWEVALPAGTDLLVLDDSPTWLSGRVAQFGRVLFEDDPAARVAWQADRRLQFLDEAAQRVQDRAEYLEAITRGGR